ncbi:HNH endonuclease signature motif containing protein [Sinomonas notoginsengisoli]|uniref:HNH endonuclease signature motif containing protein n=1 Tax=Sinomonas notoginsengisoli TaxID=1457311 RepID=UPI001F411814|nr:HNH endonuclease signature motif containing protein [Sinomonas notoginsengisoli]
MDAATALDDLSFASRHPDVLRGTLRLDERALDTPQGVADALRAFADFDAYSASMRAVLSDRHAQQIAEEPLAGRDGQPTRLNGEIAHAAAVSELATLQGTSEAVAARALNFSTLLVNMHPAIHEALASGDITEAHARVLVEQACSLPEQAGEAFGIEALARIRTRKGRLRTPSELRTVVRDLRERLHPESIVRRRAKAREDRGVWLRPEEDGMCTLTALLPAEAAHAAYQHIGSMARAAHRAVGEYRTLPQLRADVFAHLALPLGTSANVPAPYAAGTGRIPEGFDDRITAEIVVHIPAAVALGASDDVALLDGFGVIDAETARRLAAAAPTWKRLLTDEAGTPVGLGRTAYRPPEAFRRFILFRDGTCVVPGCTCPAQRAEVDHTIEWQDGGTTDPDNLALLCRKHHALKSLALFRLRREAAKESAGKKTSGDNQMVTGQTVSGELVWETLLGNTCPAEALDRDHILGPRTLVLPLESREEPQPADRRELLQHPQPPPEQSDAGEPPPF